MKDGAVRGSRGFRDFPKRPHRDNNRAQVQPKLPLPPPPPVPPDGESLEDRGPFPCRRSRQPCFLLMCQGAHFQTEAWTETWEVWHASFRSHTCTCYIKALKPELEHNLPKQADS